MPRWTGGGGLSLQLANLPLACAQGVVQVQLGLAAALHLFLNLAELVLQLADVVVPVLELLPELEDLLLELEVLLVLKLLLALRILKLCRVF